MSKLHDLWCSTEKDCWQQQHHVAFWPIKVVGAGNQDRHLPPLTDFLPQGLGAGGQTPSVAGVSLPSAWNPKLLGMTVWLFSVPQSHSTPTQSCCQQLCLVVDWPVFFWSDVIGNFTSHLDQNEKLKPPTPLHLAWSSCQVFHKPSVVRQVDQPYGMSGWYNDSLILRGTLRRNSLGE